MALICICTKDIIWFINVFFSLNRYLTIDTILHFTYFTYLKSLPC